MDANDRLFGEIAVRIGVLTREGLVACMRHREAEDPNQRLRQVALDLGLASADELSRVTAQLERVLEQRRKPQRQVRDRAQSRPIDPVRTGGGGWQNANSPRPGTQPRQRAADAQGAEASAGQAPATAVQGHDTPSRNGPMDVASSRRAAAAEERAKRAEHMAEKALRAASRPPPKMAAPLAPNSIPPDDADPPKAPRTRPRSSGGGEPYLHQLLKLSVAHGASDLHVHSQAQVMARVHGVLRPMSSGNTMSPRAAEKVIAQIMSDDQWSRLADKGQVDFAYEVPGTGRFRVNAYKQQGGLDVVFRVIPPDPPTLASLGLPERLANLVDYRTGMVLCTGPAGCGKSSTLAALVSLVAGRRRDHILTVEDPVEFVYPPSVALINQRQVATHTHSYASALKAALREDPDIIVIAELRDMETISLAMSAAETGHLVLGTLHTGNAAQTINRITSVFPAEEQEQARVMLAESLRAVVSQRLVPRADGRGRVAALELLMVSTAVSNIIRDNKTHQLPSVMQTGKAMGMVTLDDSLAELLASGAIDRDQAARFAVKKERFAVRQPKEAVL